ncbi:hypothetical protein [Luminiphilus syltensis]|uniref:hypothetical protein n=1 Tax=Luminiphilus syltensis TaxID=1341119 RepID=UPI0012B63C3E|nr:hypothetical protein [Luminiphilus syltensis]
MLRFRNRFTPDDPIVMRLFTPPMKLTQARWCLAALVVALLTVQVAATQHDHAVDDQLVCESCHSGAKAIATDTPSLSHPEGLWLAVVSRPLLQVARNAVLVPPSRGPPLFS